MNNERVKILHVITSLNVGGAETMLYRLLKSMDASRFENQVVCLIHPGPVGERIQSLGVPVFSLNMRPGRQSLDALIGLVRLLRRESPDLLQTWLYHADLLGVLATKISATPVIWNIRASNMDMSHYRRLSSVVLRACVQLSGWPQAVIVNSRAGQEFHAHLGYHPRRWVHIPNGIDTGLFQPDPPARMLLRKELGLAPDSLIIGLVARLDPMKDHWNFFRAASLLVDRSVDVHFVLAGTGVEPSKISFYNYFERYELHGRLHLLGQRDDISSVTAALDIASSSSSFGEGFSNTIAEAMSCGIPCVVTDVGDSANLVGESGIVVPPMNPQALAEGWHRMISLAVEGRNELGAIARQRIQQNFQQDEITRQYEILYESLMTTASQPS
jgi:glycosyltransferase involved in cell wall biosynthesis